MGKSSEDLKYLGESVVAIMKLLQDEIEAHPSNPDEKFVQLCNEFNLHLIRISKEIESMSKAWSSSKFKKYLKVNRVRDEIAEFTRRVSDMRANATLIAATGARMDLIEVATNVSAVRSDISRIQTGLAAIHSTEITRRTAKDLVRFEEDFHALKVGDMQLEFGTARKSAYTLVDGPHAAQVEWTDYKGNVQGLSRTIRVYRGENSAEAWKDFLSLLAERSPSPGLLQLFGFCSSPRLRSLVFHEELTSLDEYCSSLRESQDIVAWEATLKSDLAELIDQLGLLSIDSIRHFARVNAQNGRLMVTHLEPSGKLAVVPPLSGKPFVDWFQSLHTVVA
ncbi:hypothetical protein C8R47DRAFT_540066 [Mycena vitilis]|nr:hypothetical protein C8R47DRAFT_540066 [Mycena vitilis]